MSGDLSTPIFARVRLGYHRVASHGPVSICIDRATHQRLFVIKIPQLGEVPVPIDDVDYANLGTEIIRELGTIYNFTEPMKDSDSGLAPPLHRHPAKDLD
jgi:hypothetical protein